MNRKGFAPISIVLLAVVGLVVVIGIWLQSSGKGSFLSGLKAPAEKLEAEVGEKKPTGTVVSREVPGSPAVSVVKEFCEDFFQGPPAINEAGVVRALGLLSQKAKNSVTVKGPGPSAVLAAFAGVVDVPDPGGYTIDEVSETAEKATIKTTWKYLSGPVKKTFDLGKENGIWKIDSIY